MSGIIFAKPHQKAARQNQSVIISVKNYTNDKLQFGVPVRRSEAIRPDNIFSHPRMQTQPTDINMRYQNHLG